MSINLMRDIDTVLEESIAMLKSQQRSDGHWVFDLEADATIPAEYIFLGHYLDEREPELEVKLASYIRSIQADHGGWPLFHKGALDLSASVKAYWALKTVGDDIHAPHMMRARDAILAAGGAEHCNVFTRYAMALFGHVPWRAVPVMPIELMLMPRWFPVNIWRFSYWSRAVISPLLVLAMLKPKALNPTKTNIRELFVNEPEVITSWHKNATGTWQGDAFIKLDKLLRIIEPYFPKAMRKKSVQAALDYFLPRLNGEDGLGAIFPAMANAVMAMEALGFAKNDARLVTAKKSIRQLISRSDGEVFIQPCHSPVWDTSLTMHAMLEAGEALGESSIAGAGDWLKSKQILDVKGDWAVKVPDLEPGGWAFQYENPHYPDVDDTAVVAMALHRTHDPRYDESIRRAERWVVGMQSGNGGWGAFDVDNDASYLNYIPFADHGALLDPPTADVTARCISFLAQLGRKHDDPVVARGIAYLKAEQEQDGSWFGRWGTNYIYGTWSVLCALNAAGVGRENIMMVRATEYLLNLQNSDGGWGEDGATYDKTQLNSCKSSTPSQTAWAMLGLMAAGKAFDPAVERGVRYLTFHPREKTGRWVEPQYTAVGFPKVFYLRYHGYSAFFPVWALARYRTLMRSNDNTVAFGM